MGKSHKNEKGPAIQIMKETVSTLKKERRHRGVICDHVAPGEMAEKARWRPEHVRPHGQQEFQFYSKFNGTRWRNSKKWRTMIWLTL